MKKLVDSLLTKEEKSTYTSDELYQLQLSRITSEMLKENLSEDDIKFYMLYSKIQNCSSGAVVFIRRFND